MREGQERLIELITSYQQTITALQIRRAELVQRTTVERGQAYLNLLARIRVLQSEEQDTLAALRLLSRCQRRCG